MRSVCRVCLNMSCEKRKGQSLRWGQINKFGLYIGRFWMPPTHARPTAGAGVILVMTDNGNIRGL